MEYGETYEACQGTARKVRAARDLIELAGSYKGAVILADAVWSVASESDNTGLSKKLADEDDFEVEYRADYEAWEARTRKVLAAEKLLERTSGYDEAFMLLDTMGILMVRLHHSANHAHDEVIRHLCAELNATATEFPGTNLRLVYELGAE